jgi:hypothetical protein
MKSEQGMLQISYRFCVLTLLMQIDVCRRAIPQVLFLTPDQHRNRFRPLSEIGGLERLPGTGRRIADTTCVEKVRQHGRLDREMNPGRGAN